MLVLAAATCAGNQKRHMLTFSSLLDSNSRPCNKNPCSSSKVCVFYNVNDYLIKPKKKKIPGCEGNKRSVHYFLWLVKINLLLHSSIYRLLQEINITISH